MPRTTVVRLASWIAALALLAALAMPVANAQGATREAPRNINDILKVLDHYKPDPAAVTRAQEELRQDPPQTTDHKLLREFYVLRSRAADKIGAPGQSIASLTEALKHSDDRDPEGLFVMRQLANAEILGGNFFNATKLLETIVRNTPRNAAGLALAAHQQLASLASNLGDLSQAERALSRAEDLFRNMQRSPAFKLYEPGWTANIERARGDVLRAQGKLADAENAYQRALKAQIADAPLSEERRRQGLITGTEDTQVRTVENIKLALAKTQQRAGRFAVAERTQREVLQAALERVGRYHYETGRYVSALAEIIADQGRFAESAILSREAVSILEKSGSPESSLLLAEARKGLATALVANGREADALKVFDALRAGLATDPEALARYNLDDLDWVQALMRTGQHKAAAEMSTRMRNKARSDLGDRDARTTLIRCFHAATLVAVGDYQRSLEEYRDALGPFLETARADQMADAASIRTVKRRAVILDAYLDLMAEAQSSRRVLRGLNPVFASFRMADIARGSRVQFALSASAARANISDPALADLARREQDIQRQVRLLQESVREQLAAPPGQQIPEAIARMRGEVEALQKERNTIRSQIEARFPDYADLSFPRPPSVDEIQRALQPGEVLVTMYFGERSGYVWAIPHNGPGTFASVALGTGDVAKTVETLRKALDPQATSIDDIPPFDVALAAKLYEQLFKPVEAVWKDAKSLLVVPHGPLGALPLGLLPTAQVTLVKGALPFEEYRAVPWLARTIALTQLPSIRSITGLRRAAAPKEGRRLYLGIGDPFFSVEQAAEARRNPAGASIMTAAAAGTSRGAPVRLRSAPKTMGVEAAELALLPRLPDTADELIAIAKSLGADPERDLILHQNANEKTIRSMNLADRRIVHFATHGLVPGELEGLTQPALALTAPAVAGVDGDGLLTMDEILGLKLNADWVVLSACNTASGAGEGAEALSGLGSAFFYAGARALLVSNWPVDSVAARLLMSDLFKRYATGTASKTDNLRQAMLAMIDSPGSIDPATGKPAYSYAHPLFWAPFVLVGD